jgi:hypothetical protein
VFETALLKGVRSVAERWQQRYSAIREDREGARRNGSTVALVSAVDG